MGIELYGHFVSQALRQTAATNWYLLAEPFPSLALVRVTQFTDDFAAVAEEIMRMIRYLCDNCIPHNVFCTLGREADGMGGTTCLRTIIYPRASDALARSKELSGFNVACFELAGYVPVGSKYLPSYLIVILLLLLLGSRMNR